jgi:dephospho-CoA kinase
MVQAIARSFGNHVLTASGELDRARLRERVFSNPEDRRKLEQLLHPEIRKVVDHGIRHSTAPYLVLVVPLLVETGSYAGLIDRILVVDCPEELQIQRVMQRSGLSHAAVEDIVRAQASRSERLARADDVIVNDGPAEALGPAIRDLHLKYLRLAGRRG